MKNSRRSDRYLAKAVGVSQPTISRMTKKLEKEGYIKEYTIIPDFAKLGYTLLGFTFVRQKNVTAEELKKVKKSTAELEDKNPFAKVTMVHGMGLGKDFLFTAFYKDYSEFTKSMEHVKKLPFTDIDEIDTFLVNTSDPRNVRLLSMRKVADHSIALHKEEGNKP